MRYTVTWTTAALDDLADLWLNATDQAAIAAASNQIDVTLRRNPYSGSRPLGLRARIKSVPPLAVAYDVSDDDLLVTVWGVKLSS